MTAIGIHCVIDPWVQGRVRARAQACCGRVSRPGHGSERLLWIYTIVLVFIENDGVYSGASAVDTSDGYRRRKPKLLFPWPDRGAPSCYQHELDKHPLLFRSCTGRGPIVLDRRESGPAPAARGAASARAETQTPALGSELLGLAVAQLEWLAIGAGDREAGHGRPLASARIPLLLALKVGRPTRLSAHRPRGPRPDSRPQPRQPALGSAADSARITPSRHDLAKSTVAKYMVHRSKPPSPGWRSFLKMIRRRKPRCYWVG